jgi:hypothetical protein
MAAAAAARKQTAAAPARRPRPQQRPRPRPRARQAPAGRLVRPAMAGAALVPQAAVRSVGAVRDISDSGLIMRLTRGRGWIAVLCTLLGGIVALNVISLSLTAGSGRDSLQISQLQTDISALQAQIDERLSAARVENEAARLGLAVPDPKAITYLDAHAGDAERLAHLLGSGGFLLAPSQPSSYPTGGQTYAPVSVSSTPSTTTSTTTSSSTSSTSAPAPATTTVAPTASRGSSSGSGSGSSGSSGGSTGGVGL